MNSRITPGCARCIIFITSVLSVLLTAPVSAEKQKPVVGVVAPLSGYIASIGSAVRNGIELAQLEHPQLTDSIQLQFEDDQHDPKLAATVYNHLNRGTQPRAVIAFGYFFPTAIGKQALNDQIPIVNLSFMAKPAIGNPYIIRSMNHTGQYGKVLADFLASETQLEYPVVLTEYDFFIHLLKDTTARLHEVKPEVSLSVTARVLPSEQDFRSIILKLKPLKAKRIGVFLLGDQLATFMRHARENGLDAEIFGADLCETAAKIKNAEQYLEGCVYPDNEVTAEFRSAYRTRFHDESQLTFAGVAYDMAVLLAEQFQRSPNSTNGEVLSLLAKVNNRAGVLGTFSYRDDPQFGKFYEYPIVMKKIVHGVGVALSSSDKS
jgi:ABC-type branched-subunit amino acid transport system substrate-binding protein